MNQSTSPPALPHSHSRRPLAPRRLLALAIAASVTPVLALASPQQALAKHEITVPNVPANLQVPAGNEVYLVLHAVGTQNYVCLPSGGGYAWGFFGPQATLFDADDKQKLTHFLSSDPLGTARPAWLHSKDSSTIWGAVLASASSVTDPGTVAAGAIPWLLVEVVDAAPGPDGGEKLVDTTYIHRLNTAGGVAPASGCAAAIDVGKRALVPYTTDYYFYRED